jgi:hypothetical protein
LNLATAILFLMSPQKPISEVHVLATTASRLVGQIRFFTARLPLGHAVHLVSGSGQALCICKRERTYLVPEEKVLGAVGLIAPITAMVTLRGATVGIDLMSAGEGPFARISVRDVLGAF